MVVITPRFRSNEAIFTLHYRVLFSLQHNVSFYAAHPIHSKAQVLPEKCQLSSPNSFFSTTSFWGRSPRSTSNPIPCFESLPPLAGPSQACWSRILYLHGLQQLHVLLIPPASFHLMVQLQDDLIFKLEKWLKINRNNQRTTC